MRRIVAAFRGDMPHRTSVYEWLLEHYEELDRARQNGQRADWIAAASELTALGLVARNGKKLRPDTVRKAWNRVDSDVKNGHATVPGRQPPVAVEHEPIEEASRAEDDGLMITDAKGNRL